MARWRTTLAKAREVRGFAEKLINPGPGPQPQRPPPKLSPCSATAAWSTRNRSSTGQSVVQKLFTELAPKFVSRPGGYTRIIKLSDHRIGDGGSLVLLQLITEESKPTGTPRRSAGLRRKRNERKHQFASAAAKKTA